MSAFSKILSLARNKFVSDSIYTLISFIILALSGILVNILVGNSYDSEGLGVFNQALAFYSLISTIGLWGLNQSALKFLSHSTKYLNQMSLIFSANIQLGFLISIFTVSCIFILMNFIPGLFINEAVSESLRISLYSIPLLSINKIALSLLNALREMKIFSLVKSLRWIFIFSFISIMIYYNQPLHYLMYSFLLTEIILTLILSYRCRKFIVLNIKKIKIYFENLVFGTKSVLLSFIYESSSKIDILFIGFFLTDSDVGIYSFASTIAMGFLLISNVVQTNLNPIISKLWNEKNIESIKIYTDRIFRIMFVIMSIIIVLSIIGYPIFVNLIMDEVYNDTLIIFYTLLLGVFPTSIYYSFGGYFTMANMLNIPLIIQLIRILVNIISCYFFIDNFGVIGAALATSFTLIISVLTTEYFIRKKMKIKILPF